MDGETPQDINLQPPLIEIREIQLPGYSYYSYYDDYKTEVNGVTFGLLVWQHSVAIPTVYFDDDHMEEITFPCGQVLHRKKEQYWFPLIRNYIYTLAGAKFYADLFWLEWQYQGGKPTDKAVQLHSKLFQLKGGPTHLNILVDDLHSESIRNLSEYTPDHVLKLYILISRWDAPVTPQGHECCSVQKEDQDHEQAVASQMHGQMSLAGPSEIVQTSHTS